MVAAVLRDADKDHGAALACDWRGLRRRAPLVPVMQAAYPWQSNNLCLSVKPPLHGPPRGSRLAEAQVRPVVVNRAAGERGAVHALVARVVCTASRPAFAPSPSRAVSRGASMTPPGPQPTKRGAGSAPAKT